MHFRQRCYALFCGLLGLLLLSAFPVMSMDLNVVWPDGYGVAQPCGVDNGAVGFVCAPSKMVGNRATVRTTFRLDEDMASGYDTTQMIWLAGATRTPGKAPDVWGLAWAIDTSSFFTTWRLELHDYIKSGDSHEPVTLGKWTPEEDHIYEVLSSYDAVNGVVSVRIQDLTSKKEVYAGGASIEPFAADYWHTAGFTSADASLKRTSKDVVKSFASTSVFVPVGATWRVGVPGSGANSVVEMREFGAIDTVTVGFTAPGVDGNSFSLRLGGSDKLLDVTFAGSADQSLVTLPPGTFPLGKSELLLEYKQNGKVLATETRQIVVGRAKFRFEAVKVTDGQLTSVVHVGVDQPTDDMDINLNARLIRVDWDKAAKRYIDSYVATVPVHNFSLKQQKPGDATSVSFSMQMPQEAGQYKIVFQPLVAAGLAVTTQNELQIIHTFPSVKTTPGKSFTIAVLPDTQKYARFYPDILTRQTEWLAANAAELRLGAVLHLGDVTDRNTDAEWVNVSRSFTLLDGVVPYVLTLGNHDLCTDGEYLLSRDSVKAHNYFGQERFPAMGGAFEPGRLDNTYHVLNLGGEAYLVVSLEYGPRDSVLQWANEVVAAFPNHKVIVITHNYLTPQGKRQTDGPHSTELATYVGAVNDAEEVWDKFASKHKNILMILSGHMGSPTVPRRRAVGLNGNVVFELESDFSSYGNGGDGWMVLYEFTPEKKVNVKVYSPYLDSYRKDGDAYGFDCQFAIDLEKGWYVFQ